MSSLARSKKGFKKLETLEMVELNGSENCVVDSGSESELLDLTKPVNGIKVRSGGSATHYSCGSCCCWCGVLYSGILTLFVLIVGVVSAYALTTAWQLSLTVNNTQRPMKDEMSALKKALESSKQQTAYILDGMQQTMFTVNSSFSGMNSTMWSKMNQTAKRLGKLELQVKESAEGDEEAKQLVMARITEMMIFLNTTLTHEMTLPIYSITKILNSLSDRITALSKINGDIVHDNTDIQDSIQGFGDRILQFEKRIAAIEKNMSADHARQLQTSHDLSSNVSVLQSLLSNLNSSLEDEVGHLWLNMSSTHQVLQQLQEKVSSMNGMASNSLNLNPNSSSHSATAEGVTTEAPTSFSTTEHMKKAVKMDSTATTVTSEVTSLNPSSSTLHESDSTSKISDTELPVTSSEPTTQGSTDVKLSTTEDSTEENGNADTATTTTSHTEQEEILQPENNFFLEVTNTPATGVIPDGDTHGDGDDDDDDNIDVKNSQAIETFKAMVKAFDLLDVSGDDKLDYDEFSIYAKSKKVYKLIDFNHDGFVDKDELEKVIIMLEKTFVTTPPDASGIEASVPTDPADSKR